MWRGCEPAILHMKVLNKLSHRSSAMYLQMPCRAQVESLDKGKFTSWTLDNEFIWGLKGYVFANVGCQLVALIFEQT